ncbi:nicotinate-nucleotide adenylyltransferase [Psychrilyobacter atlanticus]|uniref:nicotinate-nucleotide adenylyltransferase n=1 Tax=Psychrilyobacter atlanticus TaxID=271091 RepID=UPI00040896F5|nr:nicotinate-nucleotide adenylyltransferase [Psychrilyobacter atlanticus]
MDNNKIIEKIGIFGGSFNPIHRGHIEMADLAIKELNLDKLYIVPVGTPSHRCNKEFVSGHDRMAMIKLACSKNKKLYPCDYEINSKKVSYTYDTLLKIVESHPDSLIYEIVGEDSAEYLTSWKNYNEMVDLCKFVFFKRKGYCSTTNGLLTIEAPLFDLSSTMIREKIKNNESLDKYIVPEVEEYIKEHRLYR